MITVIRGRPCKGVALITVLLVLAVATVLAVTMSVQQQISIHRTENILYSNQAWQYVLGLEKWAIAVLEQDLKTNNTDSLLDKWNQGIPETEVTNGIIQAKILDLQGFFNLNNLIINGEVSEVDLQRFSRLLEIQGLDQNIANAVLDWIDKDTDSRFPGGAEDVIYMTRPEPYRSANGYFTDKSELMLVEGIDVEVYQKLAPHVVALPAYTPLNVNTATEMNLRLLLDDTSSARAAILIGERQQAVIENLNEWLKHDVFAGSEISTSGLATSSEYFLVEGAVQISNRRIRHKSKILRPANWPTSQPPGQPAAQPAAQQAMVIQRMQKGLFDG